MAFKSILIICTSALLFNTISGQCVKPVNAGCGGNGLAGYGAGLGLAGYGAGLGLPGNSLAGYNAGYGFAGNGYGANLGNIASLSGGEFIVTSSSPFAPTGISVVSENTLEGILSVAGAMPFLSSISVEGQVPSGGAAGVSYSCGNGNVGIVGVNGGASTGGLGYGAGLAGGIAGAGLANAGLGCAGLGNAGLPSAVAGGLSLGGCGCNSGY